MDIWMDGHWTDICLYLDQNILQYIEWSFKTTWRYILLS